MIALSEVCLDHDMRIPFMHVRKTENSVWIESSLHFSASILLSFHVVSNHDRHHEGLK